MTSILELLRRHEDWTDVLIAARLAQANQRPDANMNVWPLTTTELQEQGLPRDRLLAALKELRRRGYMTDPLRSQWWRVHSPNSRIGLLQVLENELGAGAS